ncbi:hypothetical protein [uncultured Parasphingorhabdus sp.]|uniref:hypothetical protein n=1 Tax=uncultured Parasphingorhabdus sp. TaxID=2709694 RepID=UPI0030D79FC8
MLSKPEQRAQFDRMIAVGYGPGMRSITAACCGLKKFIDIIPLEMSPTAKSTYNLPRGFNECRRKGVGSGFGIGE